MTMLVWCCLLLLVKLILIDTAVNAVCGVRIGGVVVGIVGICVGVVGRGALARVIVGGCVGDRVSGC